MLADEFARYLDAAGLVDYDPAGITGNCFLEVVPSSPDQVVTLTEYGGGRPEVRFGYDSPSLQVRVRSTRDPRPGRARINAIYSALQDLHSVALPGGTLLLRCSARASPHPMGVDENGRHEYVVNFDLHIRQVTVHRR